MRLNRADWHIVGYAREALWRVPAPQPLRMAEAGCRSAEIACTLMADFPRLHVALCGGWPRSELQADVTWYEQQDWDRRLAVALERTHSVPPRRVLHRADPWDAARLFAPYELAVVAFSDAESIGDLSDWFPKVRADGILCGPRSEATDAEVTRWCRTGGILQRLTFSARAWRIHRHP